MNKHTQELQDQLNNSNSEPYFEIEVKDSNGEQDFILCEVYCKGNSLIAERVAVSTKEEKSKFITFDKVAIDDAFSLDEHLQELHEEVINSISNGDLFALT